MKLSIGLQQTIVTVKCTIKNRQRSDFVGQNILQAYFPFIANTSNAIMSKRANTKKRIRNVQYTAVFTMRNKC